MWGDARVEGRCAACRSAHTTGPMDMTAHGGRWGERGTAFPTPPEQAGCTEVRAPSWSGVQRAEILDAGIMRPGGLYQLVYIPLPNRASRVSIFGAAFYTLSQIILCDVMGIIYFEVFG